MADQADGTLIRCDGAAVRVASPVLHEARSEHIISYARRRVRASADGRLPCAHRRKECRDEGCTGPIRGGKPGGFYLQLLWGWRALTGAVPSSWWRQSIWV